MTRRKTKEKFIKEREVRPAFHVTPKNENQEFLMRSIEQKQLVISTGFAGTGKTYIAGMMASKLLLKGEVQQIVLTRANIPTGRTLGSFPGTVEEKLSPWLAPMLGVLKEGLGKGDVECRMGKSIHMQPLETIRGQSFENAVILVDEAQNLTMEEIKAITTRIGENSKLVLMGDSTQSDINGSCAMMKFARICNRNELDVPVVEFSINDIVRSDIVADLVRVFYEESL